MPYEVGTSLELEVINTCQKALTPSHSVKAFIYKIFDVTMSPVMRVRIRTQSGGDIDAILKLYDRRFGADLRRVEGKYAPITHSDEEIFRSSICSGDIFSIIQELEEEEDEAVIVPKAWHNLDGTPRGQAKYEVALWRECNSHFACETEAYERLMDLQGVSIPQLYAHVRLVPSSAAEFQDTPEPNQTRHFSEIKGILMARIPGYSLWDISVSPLAPSDRGGWKRIIQSAVDAAHDINKRGIIMQDCAPRNVVVDAHSQSPFIIDFAQCCFKDKLIKMWEGMDATDGEQVEDWDPETEYWEMVLRENNPAAIGAVMVTRVLRTNNLKLEIDYPNYEGLISQTQE